MDVQAAVDDVQQDRLAGDEVEGVREEGEVLGHEVDLARGLRESPLGASG